MNRPTGLAQVAMKATMRSDKPRLYLSVDFEDFSHDNLRSLGAPYEPTMRREALLRSLDVIQDYATRHFRDPRMTFFCTGIVARKCPDVVRRIADLGHEVACHYHFHDDVRADNLHVLSQRLSDAKAALEDAGGQVVRGFRAPRFSIDADDRHRYGLIEEHFDYDSSMRVDSVEECIAVRKALGLTRLRVFPVGCHRVRRYLKPIKTGGTYLKLFPVSIGIDLLRRSTANGLLPMLYLHPYEFVADRSFMIGWKELGFLRPMKRALFYARQTQWHVVGNKGMNTKLDRVFAEFQQGGRMCDLLATDYALSSDKTQGRP